MNEPNTQDTNSTDSQTFKQLLNSVYRGIPQIIGFVLIGACLVTVLAWIGVMFQPIETTMRVTFSFAGFERGTYPDDSKFQPDDLRAPDLVGQALKNINQSSNDSLQSALRSAITISGVIPDYVARDRDKLRSTGVTPPPYITDEYTIALYVPSNFPLSKSDRERFLNELVSLYQSRFQRLYGTLPAHYGTAFSSLKGSDYYDYELVLTRELEDIGRFLTLQADHARSFRSVTTGYSFNDLHTKTELFSELRVNDVMGMIYEAGLTSDRVQALRKIDYQLGLLNDQERRLSHDDQVVQDLLDKVQGHAQSYLIGAKTQTETARPTIDQELLNTLIANDAYNLLVRRALETGLNVQDVNSEIERLKERRARIDTFNSNIGGNFASKEQLTGALKQLEIEYNSLIQSIRETFDDFDKQEFADAVRISARPTTIVATRMLILGSLVGGILGGLLATGLSILNIYVYTKRRGGSVT